jgi:cytochrome oxidase Cu insertion factor (SCO1/SenC/PrrC family)
MRSLSIPLAPLVLSLAALLACSSGGGSSDLEADLVPTGSPAPDVTVIGMDDAAITLSSLRGKTLLVNFWFYH